MTIEQFQQKHGIIGRSKEIRDLIDITMQVAQSDISVLIYGESGVGKEVFARAIHGFSKRAEYPMVSVNCGAIPEGILESELFGHKKGSFTGAIETRKGYFELADNGTLFLDEIAEMPITTQVKLLRAIETKEFMRIGAETITKVDVRFIAATNRDLQAEVDSKRFREDLYFRLKAVTLNIPPLRKRRIDIPEMVELFIKSFTDENNLPPFKITSEAMDVLISYNWPGNVRELKNTIETAAALSKNGTISKENFISLLKIDEVKDFKQGIPVLLRRTPEEVDREFIYRALFELKRDILEIKDLIIEQDRKKSDNVVEKNETISVHEAEKRTILNALKQTRWNKKRAAAILRISERTLYRKIKEYDIYE
ncbi:MAG TPA: sigma-54 dependent transcriptional regulator [Ignavibacteriaceae bacterium]|nr:sigma-54 dependent transcriptional regulator [Ignavibacteriaceae bacterium]